MLIQYILRIQLILLLPGLHFHYQSRQERDSVEKAASEGEHDAPDSSDIPVFFNEKWKYFIADDSLFAQPSYMDTAWHSLKAGPEVILQNDSVLKNIYGIVWFRTWVQVDSPAVSKALGVYIRQTGSAATLYIDGRLVQSFGKVGSSKSTEEARFNVNTQPYAVVFPGAGRHLLAVRYSSWHARGFSERNRNGFHGFEIAFTDLQENLYNLLDRTVYFPVIFLFTVFLTLGAVHTIMFIYFRSNRQNLYFGLYCLGIAFLLYVVYYIISETNFEVYSFLSRSIIYLAPLVVVPLVALYHTIYYQRLLKVFWLLLMVYAAAAVSTYMEWKVSRLLVAVVIVVATVEIVRMNIRSIVKGRDGAIILGLGILYIPFSIILIIIAAVSLEDNAAVDPATVSKMIGYTMVLSIPFSITLYLSRNYARVNKKLIIQVSEIRDLSERNLQQELERQRILEEQNQLLEQRVHERTRELEGKNALILQKNREITDNLSYAQRIQAALLPDVKEIRSAFRSCFVLYMPRDIVSGDFYAFFRRGDRVWLAAADCTGHGVSGAMMSMIGSSLLGQIINTRSMTGPGEVLDLLSEEVVASLNQRSGDSNDGMDIALCAFDPGTGRLSFAGANRPLWLISEGQLRVIRPDKAPIGGMQIRGGRFTSQEVDIRPGDQVYLFSDGFADQFGGEYGKKLMTRRFRELLLEASRLEMDKQEAFLREFIINWRRGREQLDDILVVGITV